MRKSTIDLSFRQRVAIILGLLAIGLLGLSFVDPIPQDPGYHRFADTRWLFGIPNFGDVMSNAGFALVGALGTAVVLGVNRGRIFVEPSDARPYVFFFVGVALISLGSAYYHWAPSNERLFWDRLPISVALMALSSAIIADRIDARAGNAWVLVILIAAGLSSLLYWDHTEELGRGDLRFYAFVQFFPVVLLPVLLWLFPDYRYLAGRCVAWVIAWYGLSKLLEHYDAQVFEILGYSISGHTLKHLTAAASAFVVLRMLLARLSSHPGSPGIRPRQEGQTR